MIDIKQSRVSARTLQYLLIKVVFLFFCFFSPLMYTLSGCAKTMNRLANHWWVYYEKISIKKIPLYHQVFMTSE